MEERFQSETVYKLNLLNNRVIKNLNMLNRKNLVLVGLFALAIVIVTFVRVSTLSASLLLEWFIVLAVFVVLVWVSFLGVKRVSFRKAFVSDGDVLLNPREQDMLLRIADGLSNKEIAKDLHIAESTVKKHVSKLYLKLGAKRRTDAIRIAEERGLLKNVPVEQ